MTNSVRTQQFLKRITRRLSGREDCRHVEYLIGIGVPVKPHIYTSDELKKHEDYIYFDPDVYVYKDNKHRKDVDLFRIVDLILHKYYENELVKGRDEYGNLKVDTSKLVKGVYKYQISMDGKRRRWIRYNPYLRLNSKF